MWSHNIYTDQLYEPLIITYYSENFKVAAQSVHNIRTCPQLNSKHFSLQRTSDLHTTKMHTRFWYGKQNIITMNQPSFWYCMKERKPI